MMKSRSNLGARIDAGLRQFAERMEAAPALADGAMAARIVGEFSAGKTRMLRELLGSFVPEPISPISSRDPQTRLPLEVTFGPVAALGVVERAHDTEQGRQLASLGRFPERADIDALGYVPERHRLRLSVPIAHFILQEGDRVAAQATPRRLFLIDMPGWNSGDDELAEALPEALPGARLNLALVYVSASTRLDSAGNRARLQAFLAAIEEAEFLGATRLLFVVTHCPLAEHAATQAHARKLVEGIWTDVYGTDFAPELELEILCADFNTIPAAELDAFRHRFWTFLLDPLVRDAVPGHPWQAAIAAWPAEWDIRPRLRQTHALLEELSTLIERARVQGNFLNGMNRYRLAGLDAAEIQAKVHAKWREQCGFSGLPGLAARIDALRLDGAHPLAPWWREAWFDQLRLTVAVVRAFIEQAQRALDGIGADTLDLEAHLRRRLDKPHARARRALESSFARMARTAHGLADAEPAQAVGTLLALGALQGRYEQHYAAQLQRLRQE